VVWVVGLVLVFWVFYFLFFGFCGLLLVSVGLGHTELFGTVGFFVGGVGAAWGSVVGGGCGAFGVVVGVGSGFFFFGFLW